MKWTVWRVCRVHGMWRVCRVHSVLCDVCDVCGVRCVPWRGVVKEEGVCVGRGGVVCGVCGDDSPFPGKRTYVFHRPRHEMLILTRMLATLVMTCLFTEVLPFTRPKSAKVFWYKRLVGFFGWPCLGLVGIFSGP